MRWIGFSCKELYYGRYLSFVFKRGEPVAMKFQTLELQADMSTEWTTGKKLGEHELFFQLVFPLLSEICFCGSWTSWFDNRLPTGRKRLDGNNV